MFLTKQFANPQGMCGRIITKLMNISNQDLYHNVLAALPTNETQKILDIGYGNGYLIRKLIKKKICNIYGLEISESMQDLLVRKIGNRCNNHSVVLNQCHMKPQPLISYIQ